LPSIGITPSVQHTSFASSVSNAIPAELTSLNKLFLDGYTNQQALVISNTSPVIVANFSTLILYRDGTTETNTVIPNIYHSLKAIAHVPFGIYLRIEPYTKTNGPTLPVDVIAQLQSYLDRLNVADAALTNAGFSSTQLVRQHLIIDACKSYVGDLIKTEKSSLENLIAFANQAGPLILANADDAARAQIDLTHQSVM
jgi:hypothetical protein